MLSHAGVWAAIDALADRHGLSASALARKAGLDSTAFNRSKRQSGDGRLRWPSTESVAKALAATNGITEEAAREMFVARQPMGRLGTAREIADIALYLASDEAAFTTGQMYMVDGGMTI